MIANAIFDNCWAHYKTVLELKWIISRRCIFTISPEGITTIFLVEFSKCLGSLLALFGVWASAYCSALVLALYFLHWGNSSHSPPVPFFTLQVLKPIEKGSPLSIAVKTSAREIVFNTVTKVPEPDLFRKDNKPGGLQRSGQKKSLASGARL